LTPLASVHLRFLAFSVPFLPVLEVERRGERDHCSEQRRSSEAQELAHLRASLLEELSLGTRFPSSAPHEDLSLLRALGYPTLL
jgi:hypothetical protein